MSSAIATPAAIERQLADLRSTAAGDKAGIRTHIVDLVGYADDPAVADELCAVIAGMRHHRPSRAIVACGGSVDELHAEASVFCAPMQEGGSLVCCELVRLDGPADGDAVSSMAASLLLPDLPVFLLWLAAPAFDGGAFAGLGSLATRIVTDSTRHPETLDALPALVAANRHVITDLARTKITGWREVVAGIFDDPPSAARLANLERVAITHVAGSDAQARLLAGWLGASTGGTPVVDLDEAPRPDMRAGSLVQVTIDAGGARFTIERPDEGVAVVTAAGRTPRRAALRVPPFEMLVGDELEFLATDRAFLAALEFATDAAR